jgi:hypothetical protein
MPVTAGSETTRAGIAPALVDHVEEKLAAKSEDIVLI